MRAQQWDIIKSAITDLNAPWLLLGDLNFIMDACEKSGGNKVSQTQLDNNRDLIEMAGLYNLPFSGNIMTCSNRRHGAELIQERLDRALGNDSWFNYFPNSHVFHLAPIGSDHSPILVTTARNNCPTKKPRKFNKCWLRDPQCKDIIGNINRELELLHAEGVVDSNDTRLIVLHEKLDYWNKIQADFYSQRAKDDMLNFDDKNSANFHTRANHRKRRSQIECI
ncbi:uncharacterized protein LOC113273025 [Papaver somniferum]|uniref:uncharacterized protein LOC113273025 n=1 Tax=Papaver somniferum TaxID=3469 RepID=UPI000E6FB16A|nr:uncharacterized protein LOC113273025 [Papaver somniferum]